VVVFKMGDGWCLCGGHGCCASTGNRARTARILRCMPVMSAVKPVMLAVWTLCCWRAAEGGGSDGNMKNPQGTRCFPVCRWRPQNHAIFFRQPEFFPVSCGRFGCHRANPVCGCRPGMRPTIAWDYAGADSGLTFSSTVAFRRNLL